MHDTLPVRFVERLGYLNWIGRNSDSLRAAPEAAAMIPETAHDQEIHAVLRVEVEDRAVGGWLNFEESIAPPAEALAGSHHPGALGEDLQGDIPIEALITGPVHDAHPAFAQDLRMR
jgi:hypothetical protein